ncbi:MAG: LysR family transcriptional regulator [Desulfobacteraceae bacterium]
MSGKKKNGKKGIYCDGRFWLESEGVTFLGYGRVMLLEHIRDNGSISKAAVSMKMSYKHAWDLLNSMESQAGLKLVEKVRGGANGGGAKLTEAGEKAIEIFWKYSNKFLVFMDEMTKELNDESFLSFISSIDK